MGLTANAQKPEKGHVAKQVPPSLVAEGVPQQADRARGGGNEEEVFVHREPHGRNPPHDDGQGVQGYDGHDCCRGGMDVGQ